MADKKLTDEEIIKSLQCCLCDGSERLKCQDDIKNICRLECNKVATETINFINQQKAEIERLKECPKCVYEYDGEITEYCVQGPCGNFKTVEQVKAEAYKEFAERLKSYLLLNKKGEASVISFENVDNLLKEMVGKK